MKQTINRFVSFLIVLATVFSCFTFLALPVSATGWSLQVATPLEEGKDNYAYALADYDKDGIDDLFCFKLRNAASKTMEVHILSGSSSFSTFILHTDTILGEPGNTFKFVVCDVNADGFIDVIALKVRGTESSKTEIHILNGADGYKSWLLQKAIPLNEALDNCSFSFANIDNGNVPDLYITKFNNTGSGNVEVHVLSGESNYSEFVLRTSVPLGQTDSSKFRFGIGHFNGHADSIPDLYSLKVSDCDSGRLEIHALNGHNSFQTFLSHQSTILVADNKNFEYLLGTYKGSPALYCIKKANASSHRTEVHVMTIDGAQLPSQNTIQLGQYSTYTGVDYTKLTSDKNRIAALDKAKAMVTVRWTAPCDFVTWCSSTGSYNKVIATDGTESTKYIKGKTYVGIPYSMNNHSYDEQKWLKALPNITTQSMAATYYSHNNKGTALGVDCSYFVYTCFKNTSIANNLKYQTTKSMLNSDDYTELKSYSELQPADLLLKNGHVMLFVGKTGNGKYAVFEATAEGSKCRYYEFSYSEITRYKPYRFNGFDN